MPLYMISDGLFNIIPARYATYAILVLVALTFVRAWAHGKSNTRERDLHGRTILVTGGFTPLGITIVTSLAERGAQVVALTPSLSHPLPQLLLPLLQQTTNNPLIFAEQCDVFSPASIKAFHSQFVKGKTGTGTYSEAPRVDAIIFLHEYAHIGLWGGNKKTKAAEQRVREEASYGTFLLTTLFLPFLLRSSAERDVRLINVVNPLYAAAVTSFDPATPIPSTSISELEGDRALRTVIFSRHCQRVLDALASPPPLPTDETATQVPVVPKKSSNIKCMAVCPGISRAETVAPFLGASKEALFPSTLGTFLYFILFPFTFVLAKSTKAASQSPLYALFVPHPLKINPQADKEAPEVIQGGELYRECVPVRLPTERGVWLMGEESVGRAVWEWFEKGVEKWEKDEKASMDASSEKGKEKAKPAEEEEDGVSDALPNLKGKFKDS